MEKNLYIDASHPNEIRIVLKSGEKIEVISFINMSLLISLRISAAPNKCISERSSPIFKNSFDPEFDPNTQSTRRYPITRSFTLGIRASL